jgi:hypothetical protein
VLRRQFPKIAQLVVATLDSRTVLVAVYFAADNDLAPYIPLIGARLRADERPTIPTPACSTSPTAPRMATRASG